MALFTGETTKWEDIQIKMGNFAERAPKGPSQEELFQTNQAKAESIVKQDFVNSLLPIDEDEPDLDLQALRFARLEQLKRQDQQTTVRRITKENYVDEVTEGSKSAVIVVLMDRGGGSSFQESEVRNFAQEWILEIAPSKNLHFCQVRFYLDDLIGPQFPSASLPFGVVYAQGTCQSQLQNATILGLRNALLSAARLTKIVEPHEDDSSDLRREIAARQTPESDASADESEDDYQRTKGYSSTVFARDVLRSRHC